MKLDELTPTARRRVLAAIARDEVGRIRPAVGGAPASDSPARRGRPVGRWACAKCGARETFTSLAGVERHIGEAHDGAGRYELVLEVEP